MLHPSSPPFFLLLFLTLPHTHNRLTSLSLYSSADVYSITMLLWEMMTLNKPFEGYSYNRLKKEIFSGGMRPELKQVKSKVISELISNGWHANPKKRPTIDMVYEIIKKEYIRLAPHVVTENEVTHHRRRSTFVVRSVKRPSPGGGGDGGHGSK